MTEAEVRLLIERINRIADRVFPSAFGGNLVAVSPNGNTGPVVRPDGDVHVGNIDQRSGLSPRWSQLRAEVEGDGFATVDCGCGVYPVGGCFVATDASS